MHGMRSPAGTFSSRLETAEKLRLINARQGLRLRKLVHDALPALAGSALPLDRKVIRLREIADKVGAAIAPFTPCRKGCSACCHKPALISEMDAMLISEATGKPLAAPRRVFDVTAGEEARRSFFAPYAGTPCPFLKDDACSIYEHRPIVCRVHHSLEATPAPCDQPTRNVAALDLTPIYATELRMAGPLMVWSDIREFFPLTVP